MPTNLTDTTIAVNGLGRAVDGIALYQNPIDIANGHADVDNLGIPGINPKALSIGGTGLLGDWTTSINGDLDQHGLLTILHFNNLTIDTSFTATLQNNVAHAIWYVKGDFTVSAGATVTLSNKCTRTTLFGGLLGETAPSNSTGGANAGGGGHPLGGNGANADGNGYSFNSTTGRTTWREWSLRPIPGTRGGSNDSGGNEGEGGAGLTILVNGTVTINGTLRSNGGSPTLNSGGGGGGGSINIASLTTITGTGTINCKGDTFANGDGGGGFVNLMAPDFTGLAITVDVTEAGSVAGNGYYAGANVKTAEEIRQAVIAQGLLNYNSMLNIL